MIPSERFAFKRAHDSPTRARRDRIKRLAFRGGRFAAARAFSAVNDPLRRLVTTGERERERKRENDVAQPFNPAGARRLAVSRRSSRLTTAVPRRGNYPESLRNERGIRSSRVVISVITVRCVHGAG